MKRVLIAVFLVGFGIAGKAQQDYQMTHYMYDKLSFNPGFAGLTKSICGTVIFREQWAGFVNETAGPGNPTTALVNIHAPVKMLRGGLGLTYVSDKLGFESNNLARLAYSYHLGLGVGDLGIGLSAGILQKSIKADWITPDGTPYTDDNAIQVAEGSALVPDFNLGVFYNTNQLYMGLSATHLIGSDLKTLNIKSVQHFWVTAGYKHELGPEFKLRPSVLAKSDGASTQLDMNVNVLYKDMIWAGATFRIQDAIAPMLGYQTKIGPDGAGTLKIGYSYGVTTSLIKGYSNGSHDIMVNYCFNLDRPQPVQKSKNPRFL